MAAWIADRSCAEVLFRYWLADMRRHTAFPRWDRPSHTDVEAGAAGEGELAVAAQTLYHDRERPSHVSLSLLPA